MVPFCAPAIRLLKDETEYHELDDAIEHYRHYIVVFELTKRPASVPEGMSVVWDPPFAPENLVNIYSNNRREVRSGQGGERGGMAPQ